MIIPVRCFTCGKVVGNKWEQYLSLLQGEHSEEYVHIVRSFSTNEIVGNLRSFSDQASRPYWFICRGCLFVVSVLAPSACLLFTLFFNAWLASAPSDPLNPSTFPARSQCSHALTALGLKRYCCRRMLLAHVDLIEKLLNYSTVTSCDRRSHFSPHSFQLVQ